MTTPAYPKHIPSISYSDPPSRLQTLDIWLPRPLDQSDPTKSIWIIYIHGGAWRDPTQDASCVEPTLTHLFSPASRALPQIAGIASLNYRLSPYTAHATSPSTPADTERNATHPQHVRDVARGIRYLQAQHGVTRWVGVGHSCGATLLLQLVACIGLDATRPLAPDVGPEALVLLEGVYDFPLLLRNHAPPACPDEVSKVYEDFVAGAFGADRSVYHAASPVAGKYSAERWREGRLVVICHSHADELVERAQRDGMCIALDREGWSIGMASGDEEDEVRTDGGRALVVRDLKGGHDWIWEDGEQIAKLIAEVVERLI